MMTAREPYQTIEASPKENLQKLRNGAIQFEELGFASSLQDSPIAYANRQLVLLQSLMKDERLWMVYSDEISGLFIKEYYIRTLLMAANANLWETLDLEEFLREFGNMQKIMRVVFPNWINNNYLFGLGKNKLTILKSCNIDIPDIKNLEALLMDVAILGLPPMVSIVLATHNSGDKLFQVLPSILNQTYSNFEVILVDAASEDNTKEVADAFGNSRVKYIRLDENVGNSKARNVGIENASYNFIAFADCDDVWDEQKLERQVECLIAHPQAAFCYCAYEIGGKYIVPPEKVSMVRKEGYIYPELLQRAMVGLSGLVIKKECISTIGKFNEEIDDMEDWEFALRLAKAYDACFVQKPLYVSSKPLGEKKVETEKFYDGFQKDRELFGLIGGGDTAQND